MGHISSAVCRSCGYEAAARIGNGMADFQEVKTFPVCCNKCEAVSTANFYKKPLACDLCGTNDVVPFSDKSVWQGDGKVDDHWGGLELTTGQYKCPKCTEFELRFGRASGKGISLFFD